MGTGISLLLASGTGYLLHKNSESKDFAQKSSVASQSPDEKLRKMLAESVLEPAEEPALTEAEAKKLAKRIGFPSSRIDTDFLYAIKEIGPGPTERLYKDYGVTQFSRYSSYTYSKNHYGSGKRRVSEPLLNKIAANTGRQEHARPILLLAYPEYDWNQAFGEVYWSAINQMAEQYTILLIESKKEEEFYKRIRFVARTHGPITTMVLGGHGSPTGLWLEKRLCRKKNNRYLGF